MALPSTLFDYDLEYDFNVDSTTPFDVLGEKELWED